MRWKCSSAVAKARPHCIAQAAIHMSFCGMGRPSAASCALILPKCWAVSSSTGTTVTPPRKVSICARFLSGRAERCAPAYSYPSATVGRNNPASASSRAVASPPCRKCRITALLSSIRRSLLITVDSISGFAHGAFKVCALVSGHAARRCQQRRTFPLRACWRRVQVVDEFRHLHQLWRGQVAQVLARSASSGIDPPAPV